MTGSDLFSRKRVPGTLLVLSALSGDEVLRVSDARKYETLAQATKARLPAGQLFEDAEGSSLSTFRVRSLKRFHLPIGVHFGFEDVPAQQQRRPGLVVSGVAAPQADEVRAEVREMPAPAGEVRTFLPAAQEFTPDRVKDALKAAVALCAGVVARVAGRPEVGAFRCIIEYSGSNNYGEIEVTLRETGLTEGRVYLQASSGATLLFRKEEATWVLRRMSVDQQGRSMVREATEKDLRCWYEHLFFGQPVGARVLCWELDDGPAQREPMQGHGRLWMTYAPLDFSWDAHARAEIDLERAWSAWTKARAPPALASQQPSASLRDVLVHGDGIDSYVAKLVLEFVGRKTDVVVVAKGEGPLSLHMHRQIADWVRATRRSAWDVAGLRFVSGDDEGPVEERHFAAMSPDSWCEQHCLSGAMPWKLFRSLLRGLLGGLAVVPALSPTKTLFTFIGEGPRGPGYGSNRLSIAHRTDRSYVQLEHHRLDSPHSFTKRACFDVAHPTDVDEENARTWWPRVLRTILVMLMHMDSRAGPLFPFTKLEVQVFVREGQRQLETEISPLAMSLWNRRLDVDEHSESVFEGRMELPSPFRLVFGRVLHERALLVR
jgi:hypothetical protein